MKLSQEFAICGLAVALGLGAGTLSAQDKPATPPGDKPPTAPAQDGGGRRDRGNFDPAQFQQRMLDGVKERLGFSDADWSAVQPLVSKVLDARRETMGSGMSRFGRGRGGDNNRPGGDQANRPAGDRGGDRGGRPSFFGPPSPEAEALQKAIDDKAPAAQVKAALDKYRVSKKEKEAKLAAAQEDLRKVLSATQEAQATLLGLLP
jgi:hypothetical protein